MKKFRYLIRRCAISFAAISLAMSLMACGSLGDTKEQSGEKTENGKGVGAINQLKDKVNKLIDVEVPEYDMADLDVAAEGYYYRHLPEDQQEIYKAILAGLLNHDEAILLPNSKVNFDNVETYRDYIMLDHPEIFWFLGSCETIQKGKEFTIKPDYIYHSDKVASYKKRVEEEKEKAMAVINGKLADESFAHESDSKDYRTAKAIFEYVLDDVQYVEDSEDNQVLISALVNKKSVCEGIARMTQYLLQQYGMEAVLVEGYHTEGNEPHAWLIVKIDDEYYHMDPTFGNAAFSKRDKEEPTGIQELRYHYAEFLMSDEIAQRSHAANPCGDVALPACDSNAKNYFLLTGAWIPESAESSDWNAHFLDTMTRYSYWQVQFEDYGDYQECLEEVMGGNFDSELYYQIDMSQYSREYYNYDDETYVVAWWLE